MIGGLPVIWRKKYTDKRAGRNMAKRARLLNIFAKPHKNEIPSCLNMAERNLGRRKEQQKRPALKEAQALLLSIFL